MSENSDDLEKRLIEMKKVVGEEFYRIVYDVFDEDEPSAVRWFYTNNRLSGRSPKELYEKGEYIRFEKVLNDKGLEILYRNFTD